MNTCTLTKTSFRLMRRGVQIKQTIQSGVHEWRARTGGLGRADAEKNSHGKAHAGFVCMPSQRFVQKFFR